MATAKTSNDNSVNQQFLEQLKDVGNRLLLAPCSSPELLSLLDELVLLLSKVGQAPSQPVQDALLPTMKALISDHLFRNSDADVIITVAACLNEILRISAPVAPYDDDKMKEIFELIVLSFDKLSCPPGRSYSKAILILESVARLRSCVMMLDLDCDSLITKMFQLFQKHSCSSHPHSVFLAMEKIMNVMIKESDSLSVELVKVLLESIRLENQNALPESFKMGAKVIEECSEKLKPYIREAVTLLGYCLQDYAPILSSICETEPIEDLVRNSAKHSVKSELTIDERHSAEYAQPLKAVERCSQNPGTDSETASERGGKLSSHSLDEGYESLTGRGKTSQGHVKRSSGAPRSKKAVPAMEDELSEREIKQAADLDIKKVLQATTLGGSSDKKGKPSKKDVSAVSVSGRSESVVFMEEDEPKEWVAQVEPGVLITFVSMPQGGNDLKRIRFSRELFNKWQAQRWWAENYDKVMELYNVQKFNQQAVPSATPSRSEDESSKIESAQGSPATPPLSKERLPRNFHRPTGLAYSSTDSLDQHGARQYYESYGLASTPKLSNISASKTETSSVDASARSSLSREVDHSGELSVSNASDVETEWVEQDEPGVYITIRALPNGSRELRRVRFSRERFGEMHARVWWEENKARIQEQYL